MKHANLVDIWNAYSDILWEPGRHKESCRCYVLEIQNILARNEISSINNNLVDVVTSNLRAKGNRNSTVNRKLSCLSKLLRKHQRNGGIDRLPDFRKLPERNGRIRYLSRAEEAWLFASLDEIDGNFGALARLLIDTGARVGEALQLRWADTGDETVTFWETKANLPRSVPLTGKAKIVLAGQRGKNRIGPFAMVRYPNFRNAWNRAKVRCGLAADDQIVPHILRHTCASRLAQSGVDIKRIQEFLGHKTLTMTLRYAHLAPRHLDVCAKALDALEADAIRRSRTSLMPDGASLLPVGN